MNKLNPPILDGKIPAQFGQYLKIPFSINRTISFTENLKMGLIIKTISTGVQIISNLLGDIENDYEKNTYYAIFDIENFIKEKQIIVGQFYQIQICFVSTNQEKIYEYGYYSSLGIMKYTKEPKVTIQNLNENYFKERDFIGNFFSEDPTEKVYQYEFILTDSKDNIIDRSGLQIHNSQLDTSSRETIDIWSFNKELNDYDTYYLVYNVITNNGLKLFSNRYKIVEAESVLINFKGDLISQLNLDEAYISLYLRPEIDQIITGDYILSRTDSQSNYSEWEEIYRFSLNAYPFYTNYKDILIWEDYTCQHGVTYKYGLQAYNKYGLYSERKISDKEIEIDFEDIFLFDGERQLKIEFNPKISSFKANVLETKTNTLGGKYPFIFRNGIVYYKEFQLSGLISFLMDSNKKFLSGLCFEELFQTRQKTPEDYQFSEDFYTNLNYKNIYQEKIFRDEVFKWLSNGRPKLFRSPTEGNYLIQLMNVSMTPNDTLGRMLYTFNSTANEIDNNNLLTLSKYGFNNRVYNSFNKNHISITQIILNDNVQLNNKTINLSHFGFNAFLSNAYPGSRITLWFSDGDQETIEIGKTGNYYILAKDKNLIKLKFENNLCEINPIKLTYCYYSDITNNFSDIKNIQVKEAASQHFGTINLKDIIFEKNNTILKIYSLEIKPRPIIKVFEENNKYYLDKARIYSFSSFKDFSKDVIFQIYKDENFSGTFQIYDCNVGKIEEKDIDFTIKSNIIKNNNDEDFGEIDLSKITYFEYSKSLEENEQENNLIISDFNSNFYLKATSDTIYLKNLDTLLIDDQEEKKFELVIGNGIMMNLYYQLRIVTMDEERKEKEN